MLHLAVIAVVSTVPMNDGGDELARGHRSALPDDFQEHMEYLADRRERQALELEHILRMVNRFTASQRGP